MGGYQKYLYYFQIYLLALKDRLLPVHSVGRNYGSFRGNNLANQSDFFFIFHCQQIYHFLAVAVELRGGGGLQAGHHLRPLLGILKQVPHPNIIKPSPSHHIIIISWLSSFSGWSSYYAIQTGKPLSPLNHHHI